MFARADLLVISHTKSGRTWLRVMLSRLYHLRYGTPERDLIRFDNFHRKVGKIPKIHFTRDTRFPPEETEGRAISPRPDQKTLLLVRDPRDVAVSFYYHVTRRAGAAELARKGIDDRASSMDLFSFLEHPELGVARIIRFYNRWATELNDKPSHLTLRYEDLKRDTAGEFARLCRFLGEPATPGEIEGVIAFTSFEAMQANEKAGFFNSDRLGAIDPNDPASAKVREGRIGGYRSLITADQAAVLDRMVARDLVPSFGYVSDPS